MTLWFKATYPLVRQIKWTTGYKEYFRYPPVTRGSLEVFLLPEMYHLPVMSRYRIIQELKYINRHHCFSRHVSREIKDAILAHDLDLIVHDGDKICLCQKGRAFLRLHYDDPSPRKMRRDAKLRGIIQHG